MIKIKKVLSLFLAFVMIFSLLPVNALAEELPPEEAPAPEETPAVEETPVTEEAPVVEEPAEQEEEPASEEPAEQEEEPASEEPAEQEEEPAPEEAPETEEEPTSEEAPETEEEPTSEEPPETEEEPAPEEEPASEEDPEAEMILGGTILSDTVGENILTAANFPDANFLAALQESFSNGLTRAQAAAVTMLSVTSQSIASLQGIEFFTGLKVLYAYRNADLTSVDLSANTALTELYLNRTGLASLDLSKNTALVKLYLSETSLTALDLSAATALELLDAGNTPLASLDLSKNTALKRLSLNNAAALGSLNLSANTELSDLNCSNCEKLSSLDLSRNTKLETLHAEYTSLSSLDLRSNPLLRVAYVSNSALRELKLGSLAELMILNCSGNRLTALDLTQCPALTTLYADNNRLPTLDVTHNAALTYLSAANNELTTLDLTGNPELGTVDVQDNYLIDIRASYLPKLQRFYGNSQYAVGILMAAFSESGNFAAADLGDIVGAENLSKVRDIKAAAEDGRTLNLISGSDPSDLRLNPDTCWLTYNYEFISGFTLREKVMVEVTAFPETAEENVLTAVHFPDAKLLAALKALYPNGLTRSRAATVISLDVSNKSIASLAGIDLFKALKTLTAYGNPITVVDLSANKALKELDLDSTKISVLDVSANTELTTLICGSNTNLTALDLSSNTKLETLYVSNTGLTALDLTGKPNLTSLFAANLGLTRLDVSSCTNLKRLECNGNALPTLDLSSNTKLTSLYCDGQNVSADADWDAGCCVVDVTELVGSASRIRSVTGGTLADGKVTVAAGSDSFTYDYMTGHGTDTMSVTVKCVLDTTNILISDNFPDGKFLAALKQLYPSGLAAHEAASVTALYVDGKSVTNLQGIEYFTGLQTLLAGDNASLTSVDLSANRALTVLYLENTGITAIDLSANTALTELSLRNTGIKTVNLSKNRALQTLNLSGSGITALELSTNAALTMLDVGDAAALTSLKLSGATGLLTLHCSNCEKLTALDLSRNTKLRTLYADHTALSSLDLRANTSLTGAYVGSSALTELRLGALAELTELDCADNQLTTLDVTQCPKLKKLTADRNRLSALDVTRNAALTNLSAAGNALTVLDLRGSAALAELNVRENSLIAVSANTLPKLKTFDGSAQKSGAAAEASYDEISGYAVLDLVSLVGAENVSKISGIKAYDNGGTQLAMPYGGDPAFLVLNPETCRVDYTFTFVSGFSIRVSLPVEVTAAEINATAEDSYASVARGEIFRPRLISTGTFDVNKAELEWTVLDEQGEAVDGSVYDDLGGGKLRFNKAGTYRLFTSGGQFGPVWISLNDSPSVRVDVTDSAVRATVTAVSLPVSRASVELFKTDYTRFDVVLEMAQLVEFSGSVSAALKGELRPADVLPAAKEGGTAITAAAFADPAADAVFALRVVNDRTLEIVPRYTALEAAAADTKAVKSTYKSAVTVTVDGAEYTTGIMTIAVRKSLPAVKGKTLRFNSYAGLYAYERRLPIVFTGGTVTAVEADASRNYVKSGKTYTAVPAWLDLNTAEPSLTYVGADGGKNSGSVYLRCTVEGWAVKVPVTVKVASASSAPTVKFSRSSVSLRCGTKDSVTVSCKPAAAFAAYPMSFSRVTEGTGTAMVTYGNGEVLGVTVGEGSVELRPAANLTGTHTFKVYLSLAGKEFPITVKTHEFTVYLTLKASGYIDLSVPHSPVAITCTPKNYSGAADYGIASVTDAAGNDRTGDFAVEKSGSVLTLTNRSADAGKYKVAVTARPADTDISAEKTVIIAVKQSVPSKVKPSVSVKASGYIDPVRTGTFITLKPTVKNCYDYDLSSAAFEFYEKEGKVWTKIADPSLFSVTCENGGWRIGNSGIDGTKKYGVVVTMELRGVVCTAGKPTAPVALSVKSGKVKFTQSVKTGDLYLKDRYSEFRLTLTTADETLYGLKSLEENGIRLDASSARYFELREEERTSDSITLTLGWKDNVIPKLKAGTAKTAKLSVFMSGNCSTKADAVVSIKVTAR